MSGDQLRHAAIVGDASRLSHLLSGGGNPCSADAEGGLTALHYAAFNGHAGCVAVLLANDRGRMPETGEGGSCLDMRTEAGCTALHLCALNDGNGAAGRIPFQEEEEVEDGSGSSRKIGGRNGAAWAARNGEGGRGATPGSGIEGPGAPGSGGCEEEGAAECARLLLLSGADRDALDGEGRSPLESAVETENDAVARTLQELKPSEGEVRDFRETNRRKHGVQRRRQRGIGVARGGQGQGDGEEKDVEKEEEEEEENSEDGEEEKWILRCYGASCGRAGGDEEVPATDPQQPDRRDLVPLPSDLLVHPHRLLPFARQTFESDRTDGGRKIRDLVQALEQAEANVDRWEKLANSQRSGQWRRIEFP